MSRHRYVRNLDLDGMSAGGAAEQRVIDVLMSSRNGK
jgi:hypothetical protein